MSVHQHPVHLLTVGQLHCFGSLMTLIWRPDNATVSGPSALTAGVAAVVESAPGALDAYASAVIAFSARALSGSVLQQQKKCQLPVRARALAAGAFVASRSAPSVWSAASALADLKRCRMSISCKQQVRWIPVDWTQLLANRRDNSRGVPMQEKGPWAPVHCPRALTLRVHLPP